MNKSTYPKWYVASGNRDECHVVALYTRFTDAMYGKRIFKQTHPGSKVFIGRERWGK